MVLELIVNLQLFFSDFMGIREGSIIYGKCSFPTEVWCASAVTQQWLTAYVLFPNKSGISVLLKWTPGDEKKCTLQNKLRLTIFTTRTITVSLQFFKFVENYGHSWPRNCNGHVVVYLCDILVFKGVDVILCRFYLKNKLWKLEWVLTCVGRILVVKMYWYSANTF